MPYPSAPVVSRTWAPQMQMKAGYLRADVAAAVQIAGTPPMFQATQQTPQNLTSGADVLVNLDTEIYDNLAGHLTTSNPANYYGQFPGWYLAQGVTPLNYTGGAGAVKAGIGFSSGGGAVNYYYGQRMPNSGTGGQFAAPVAAKLVNMVNVGAIGGSNDYAALAADQNSGSTQALLSNSNLYPELHLKWVAANSGTVVSSLPLGYSAAWPLPGTTLTAQANSGATSIAVASATGLVPGGTLGLETGTSNAETVTIGGTYGIGSLTVPITAPLAKTHLSGATVNVPVSAAFANTAIRDTIRRIMYPPIMEAFYQAGSATLAQQNSLPTAGTLVPCDTVRVDNYSAFNTGTSVWTAPISGQYWCYFQCHQAMNSTSLSLAAGLTVFSANYAGHVQTTLWGGAQTALTGTGAGNCAVVRRRLRLNAGDIVAGCAFQNDSGSATTTLGFTGAPAFSESRLIIVWCGV